MTRWLVRFGYDGSRFAGWARQPGLRTVEGELIRGVVRAGLASSPEEAGIAVASRTDRGVSARANALTLSTNLPAAALLRSLNGISPELNFSAALPVPREFRVRRAVRRTYRYFEPPGEHRLERWERAARIFRGTVDVRSFGRGLPAATPTLRTVESVTVTETKSGMVVEVRAPSFVWGMVRKIIASLREHDAGRLTLDRLEAALRGEVRLTLPMAEPEGLVLWEVEYPFPWTLRWNGPNRHQQEWVRSRSDSLWVQARVLEALRTP